MQTHRRTTSAAEQIKGLFHCHPCFCGVIAARLLYRVTGICASFTASASAWLYAAN
jgi:hypothetical protein